MKRIFACLGFFLVTSAAWALPTVQQVEAEARAGRYTQAESMMSEVVAAKPGSARAHYLYAELLAHNGNFAKASSEAAKAREADPKIGFTDPDKFRTFEQTLQRELNPPARAATPAPRAVQTAPAMTAPALAAAGASSPGIPGWVWLVGLIVVALVVWKMVSRKGTSAPGAMAAGGAPYGAGPGGGAAASPYGGGPGMPGAQQYGPGQYGPGAAPVGRPGGGLLGTGLAVAGGVAGGMLLDQMLHRGSEAGTAAATGGAGSLAGLAPDGNFGAPDSAARELEDRPIDFGNGGDSWDSGGGSFDSGSDSGGGGDSWD